MINAVARADEVIERAARCMSLMGQKAKYSLRTRIFRFALDSGLDSDLAGGPFRAKSGSGLLTNGPSIVVIGERAYR